MAIEIKPGMTILAPFLPEPAIVILGWKPIVKIEHYHIGQNEILNNSIVTGGQSS
jgi:hypothetical protein